MDLSTAKLNRIARAKIEAAERIFASYPLYAQINAALGIYDTLLNTDPFQSDNLKQGIRFVIDAEHAAEAAINILTSVDDVNSFTW